MSYIICLVGAIGILVNNKEKLPYMDMICNFIVKIGTASTYQSVYIANVLFPVVFASTTFGMCCMQGAIASMFSPSVYGLGDNIPWYIFIGLSVLGLVCSISLRDKS